MCINHQPAIRKVSHIVSNDIPYIKSTFQFTRIYFFFFGLVAWQYLGFTYIYRIPWEALENLIVQILFLKKTIFTINAPLLLLQRRRLFDTFWSFWSTRFRSSHHLSRNKCMLPIAIGSQQLHMNNGLSIQMMPRAPKKVLFKTVCMIGQSLTERSPKKNCRPTLRLRTHDGPDGPDIPGSWVTDSIRAIFPRLFDFGH